MERTFRVKILLPNVTSEGDDDESLREAVKDALLKAVEADDSGEEEIIFSSEEVD